MAEEFDAYYKWLAIPPEEQPPTLYKLLGVKEFEADPDVIEAAADQRMSHLRKYQTGQRSKLSQKLLNEVSAARITLLNTDKKAEYDDALRREISAGNDDPLPASFDQLGGGTALPEPAGFESPARRPLALPV